MLFELLTAEQAVLDGGTHRAKVTPPKNENNPEMTRQRFRVVERTLLSTTTPVYASNLFARLPHGWAERLRAEASGNGDAHGNNDHAWWRVSSERLEFLPLAISFEGSGDTVYVSYNGGAPADMEAIGEEGRFGASYSAGEMTPWRLSWIDTPQPTTSRGLR